MGEGENRKSPQRALPRNKGGEGVGAYPVSDLPIAGGESRVYHRREPTPGEYCQMPRTKMNGLRNLTKL